MSGSNLTEEGGKHPPVLHREEKSSAFMVKNLVEYLGWRRSVFKCCITENFNFKVIHLFGCCIMVCTI